MKTVLVLALATLSLTGLQAAELSSASALSFPSDKLLQQVEEVALTFDERRNLQTLKSTLETLRTKMTLAERDLRAAENESERPRPNARPRYLSWFRTPEVLPPNPVIAEKRAEIREAQAGINETVKKLQKIYDEILPKPFETVKYLQKVIDSNSKEIAEALVRVNENRHRRDELNEYFEKAVEEVGTGKADEAIDWNRQSRAQYETDISKDELLIRNCKKAISNAEKKIAILNSLPSANS